MVKVQQIDHVEVYVPDQYEAAAWYQRVFGMEIVKAFEDWAADGPLMISSNDGGTMIALFKGTPPKDGGPFSAKRVAFRVDSAGFLSFLDELSGFVISADKGERLTRAHVVDHDKSWSIYFTDPYGNRYEITSYDYATIKERL
ncbi:MAG: VOC family protein [Anaerolineae bacterium]